MIDISKAGAEAVSAIPVTSPGKRAVKRSIDVFVASALLILLAPLMALIAMLIAWRDGGGVVYAHQRIGRDGIPFGCLKFRTMVRDADVQLARLLRDDPDAREEWAESQKLRNDPRILKGIGHVLRATSLDELPQLWNVLTGQMSLVGPRPVVEDELRRYGPARSLYLSVRPGLTGPWQIGARSDGTYDARVREDSDYVRNWTLSQDLAIIMRTALIVLRGRAPGAY
ncbi:sugar transferase [Jannaschia rubra]|uniref:Undecaprenyl phosphate N,N'-diacetylbacillosamine 1-phosphate transferase n=1 Tax=Jannaschia rubra TaxID=282197 RepID=A0A0M6XRA1_9RHOB|nr:sugar transferase [Jannaschia rubra]CTQ32695.1 Undecaprenyl phosphate N,N'-diacetylbacillosamine 1-phosphate transferase [Jannaschia rubra]SFF87661.1 Sugar transferase involved in LPS biosynthesis (colanic, teichoic acid) [Jannaschia rubra]